MRRTQFDLRKAEERAHVLLGLALALASLDRVIAIIRGSKDPAEAKERLTAEIVVEKAALEKFLGVDSPRDLRVRARGRRPPQARRRPGAGDPRHAPPAPHGSRARQDPRRVPRGPRRSIADLKDILAKPARVAAIVRAELLAVKERSATRAGRRSRPRPARSRWRTSSRRRRSSSRSRAAATRRGRPSACTGRSAAAARGGRAPRRRPRTSSSTSSSARRTTTSSPSRTRAASTGSRSTICRRSRPRRAARRS